MVVKDNYFSYLSCLIDIALDLCHQIRGGISGFIVNQTKQTVVTSSKARMWLYMWLKSATCGKNVAQLFIIYFHRE
jgi:hypothetical protein